MILKEQRYVRKDGAERVLELFVFELVFVKQIGSGEFSALRVVGLVWSGDDELSTRGEDALCLR